MGCNLHGADGLFNNVVALIVGRKFWISSQPILVSVTVPPVVPPIITAKILWFYLAIPKSSIGDDFPVLSQYGRAVDPIGELSTTRSHNVGAGMIPTFVAAASGVTGALVQAARNFL